MLCHGEIHVIALLFQYFLRRIAYQLFCNHVNVTLLEMMITACQLRIHDIMRVSVQFLQFA